MPTSLRWIPLLLAALLGACTSTTIDESRPAAIAVSEGDAVVVLGRRHNGHYETEPAIIDCIGKELDAGNDSLHVIRELEFMNRLYPWFEPRTAPLDPAALQRLMADPRIAAEIRNMGLQYIVWVDGSTERDSSSGSVSCAVGPGGAGCFGFGTWQDDAAYEIAIWDVDQFDSVAFLSASASGTSYMPALIVPIPLIARVKTEVCASVADQIMAMFNGNAPG